MTTLMPPNGGPYLKPMEVIARMQKAFAYVETTEEGAREHVAAWLGQLAFVTQDGRCADADRLIDQLEQSQDAACFIHFGDDLGADGMCLSMLMIPDRPLIISRRTARTRRRGSSFIAPQPCSTTSSSSRRAKQWRRRCPPKADGLCRRGVRIPNAPGVGSDRAHKTRRQYRRRFL